MVPKESEYFQDAQSNQFTAPPESPAETIPGTLVDGDGSQPIHLEPEVGGSLGALVMVPPAEDEKAEKLAMEREDLLKHAGSHVQPSKQHVQPAKQDWKLMDIDQGIQHAENLCQELHEEQIMQLLSMEKFMVAASCKGETGTIDVAKLPDCARVEFFTMVEEMVLANRKKISTPGPIMPPKPPAPPTAPVPKPATAVVVEPAKGLEMAPKLVLPPTPPVPTAATAAVVEPAKVPEIVPKPVEPVAVPPTAPPLVEPAKVPEMVPKPVEPVVAVPSTAPAATLVAELAVVEPPKVPENAAAHAPALQPAPVAAPIQKNSNADLAMLAKVTPSEPAAPSLAEDPPTPAVPAEVVSQLAPPDRTLELNGLQALMTAQKAREQQRLALAQAAAPTANLAPATAKLDWSTHKKEGMRLKRLLEESAEGDRFPHMKKLFNEGSKEDSAHGWIMFMALLHIFT